MFGLDLKSIIGYIITVVVSIVGWSLAIWQFSRQYKRSIKLSNIQKRRDLEVETTKEVIPVVLDYNKKSSDLLVALIMLKEGLYLRSKITGFTNHYFDGILNKLTEKYYDYWFAYCEVLNFYDYRKSILQKYKDTIESFSIVAESVQSSYNNVYVEVKSMYYNEFIQNEIFPENKVKQLTDNINQLQDYIDKLDLNVANFCTNMQSDFLSEIIDEKIKV